MKKAYIRLVAALLLLACATPAGAVLKEKNLDNTLAVLRHELTDYHNNLERQSAMLKAQQQTVRDDLMGIIARSYQNSLMLYSQKPDYIFDLTYACHEATEQYATFQKNVLPFRSFIQRTDKEIARYDSLITNLGMMSATTLSPRAQIDKNVCLTLAVNIRRTLKTYSEQMSDYVLYYKMTEERLEHLNAYANARYNDIQTSIFRNGGDNYFVILRDLRLRLQQTENTVSDKYKVQRANAKSQWSSRMILGLFLTILLFCAISIGVNILLVRFFLTWLMHKEKFSELRDRFMAKRAWIMLTVTVITFAITLGIVQFTVQQNFIVMASKLLVEYAWLLGVVLVSLLIRLETKQIRSAFHIYLPIVVIGFFVIAFRIILIPNDLVNLIFPPLLLASTWWQWRARKRHGKGIPKADVWYSDASFLVFLVSLACSWLGYTLFSVQLLIWWVMQLTCILTITCLRDWLVGVGKYRHYDNAPIAKVWHYRFIVDAAVPVLCVYSFIVAVYWAADVFNLSGTTWDIFTAPFINSENFSASMLTVVQAVTLYFSFAYINTTVKQLLWEYFEKSDHDSAATRNMMAKNVLQIVVWGLWFIIVMNLFHVSSTWLVVISGGLSTGVGFASKDILENIYYGISLMTGRIKVGDLISCDGIRGRVASISYTSTLIEAIDGSVIAFQNSQLFTKNYKNLTRNHGYQLDILEVGVAYGTDIAACKKLLKDAISQLTCVNKKKGVNIVLKEFADSSIVLKVLVWVPVLTQYGNDGEVMECIYNTLNNANIEIPFPQRDLHIIKND